MFSKQSIIVTLLSSIAMFSLGCTHNNPYKDADVKQEKVRVLASYPSGNFLENLEVQPDGRLLFTNYPAKTIEVMSPGGETRTFAKLSVYPLSLISTNDGYLVAASGKSLLLREDVVKTQQFIVLDKDGNQVGQFDAPQAMYLNGMTKLNDETILAADSLAGTIWKVDVNARKLSPWLQNASLLPLAEQKQFLPGANGLKLRSDGLVVSNTSKGTLSLIKVGKDGTPASEPELISTIGMIDDFWVRENGSIIFTTHGDALKSLSIDGEVTDVISEGCGGCTAVAPFPANQSSQFAVINDGNMYFGRNDLVEVLLVTVD